MVAPELVGECEESGVGTLELVNTLHKVAQNEKLKIVVHIHRELENEIVIQKGHVLRFIQHDNVHFRKRYARFQILRQNVPDTGVRVGARVVVFHSHTVVGVDIEIRNVLRFDFLLYFHAQHGVVSELNGF